MAAAVNTVFEQIVDSALSPVLALLGNTVLSTPTVEQLPGISELWNNSWQIVLACYSLLILVGGFLVMTHETVQARYSIKEIGPRIPLGFFASALSLFVADKAIRLANALTEAVLDQDLHPPSVGATFGAALQGAASGGLFVVQLRLIVMLLSLALVLVYVVRVMITMLLLLSAPLFLMGHCLPQTDPFARWWWKALGAVLAIQLAQALVLITMVRTVLGGAVHLFSGTVSGVGLLLIAIAMGYILFKIPFWLLRSTKISSGGRSMLGRVVRTVIAAKTFGALGTVTGGGGTLAAHAGRVASGRKTASAATPGPARTTVHTAGRRSATHPSRASGAPSRTAPQSSPGAKQQRPPSGSARLEFQQPEPEVTTHDPARTPPDKPPTTPTFRAPSSPPPPAHASPPRPGSRPSPPQFRAPTPNQKTAGTSSTRPPRPAPVPRHLQFQPPTPESPTRPVRASTAPTAPTFRPATREPQVGDARPRTPSRPQAPAFQPPPSTPKPPRPTEDGDTHE